MKRIVKDCYQDFDRVSHYWILNVFDFHYEAGVGKIIKCPYGDPGDVLYVKETFAMMLGERNNE